MNKDKILKLGLLGCMTIVVGIMTFKIIGPKIFKPKDNNTIAIVELSSQDKIATGEYLVVSNAVYQKALELTKEVIRSVDMYQEGTMSFTELNNVISNANKRLSYYYLVSIQDNPTEHVEETDEVVDYDLYLMRRGSEELLKYLTDRSDLRLNVGRDLLSQAILRETTTNKALAYDIARYDIDTNTVVVDPAIWDKEYQYVQELSDTVIFKDLNSEEVDTYEYYLKNVNEGFMLVSWELQNIYIAKAEYESGAITAEQLNTKLEQSGYIITQVYDNLYMLKAPEGLDRLESDTRVTITMYRDALIELQKFRMNPDLSHFEDAISIIDQADDKAGRLGEFIYSVRYQYRMD